MKTQTLIEMLARGAGPAPRAVVLRRFAPVVVLGLALSAAMALLWLGPIPQAMWAGPAPWMKLAYAGLLAAAAAWCAGRLGRPLARLRRPRAAVGAVLLAMAGLGLVAWALTPEGERMAAVMGHSWSGCPFNVFLLSLPALAGTLWALRGLAPVRPAAAGSAAGLLAGALGAAGYALACTETAPTFVAIWYTAGMGLTVLLGALLGPKLLRW